jgi:hypothetical protein
VERQQHLRAWTRWQASGPRGETSTALLNPEVK